MSKTDWRLLDRHVSMSIAHHRYDSHDLDDDLIAGQAGDALVKTIDGSLKLRLGHRMKEILVNLRCMSSEIVKIFPPLRRLARSDRRRMAQQTTRQNGWDENRKRKPLDRPSFGRAQDGLQRCSHVGSTCLSLKREPERGGSQRSKDLRTVAIEGTRT